MQKKANNSFIIILFLLFSSCSKKEIPYFGYTINEVNKPLSKIKLEGRLMSFDDINAGYMAVQDSIMLFLSSKYPTNSISVFNANTNKHILSLCPKGEGPNEFRNFTHVEQFVTDSNSIKLWIYEDNKIHLLNLTESIKSNTTKIDTTIVQNWLSSHSRPWGSVFMLNEREMLIKAQAEPNPLRGDSLSLGSYYLVNKTIDNQISEYNLFKYDGIVLDFQEIFTLESIVYFSHRMKPDKSKLVMAMDYMPQVNILDVKTGDVNGFKLVEGPSIADVFNKKIVDHIYYTRVCVSDDNIYLLYANNRFDESTGYSYEGKEIHVFDWYGNMVRSLHLDNKVSSITLDAVNNILYGMNDLDEVYAFDLPSVENEN